jgi:hypothetical protein
MAVGTTDYALLDVVWFIARFHHSNQAVYARVALRIAVLTLCLRQYPMQQMGGQQQMGGYR